MNNDGLTPEPRRDKNGKITVRHVRPSKTASAQRVAIPSPVPVSAPVPSATELGDSALLALNESGLSTTPLVVKNIHSLAGENPELLQRVVTQISQSDRSERALWDRLISQRGLYHSPDMLKLLLDNGHVPPKFGRLYEEGLTFYPLLSRLNPIGSQSESMYAENELRQLDSGRSMVPKGMDASDPAVIKAVLMFVRVEMLRRGPLWDRGIELKREADRLTYLAQNMERIEPIMDHLITSRSVDPAFIETVLAVELPVLREGVL